MEKKVEFICERELIIEDISERKTVIVRIGKPEKLRDSECVCAFQLSGLNNSQLQYAHGVDGFQALIMALEGIRVTMEKSGKSFSWQGGEKGDHGFPRFVPAFYGRNFTKHIDQLLDHEIEKFSKEAEKKHIIRSKK